MGDPSRTIGAEDWDMRMTACALCVCSMVVALAPRLAAEEKAEVDKPHEAGVYQRYAPRLQIEKVAVDLSLYEAPPSMDKSVTLEAAVYRSVRGTLPVSKRVLRVSFMYLGGKATASRKCHQLTLFADEKALKQKHSVWTKVDDGSGEKAAVVAEFPLSALERLGGAFTIRGKICEDTFTLTPDAAKWLAQLFRQAEKPPVLEER